MDTEGPQELPNWKYKSSARYNLEKLKTTPVISEKASVYIISIVTVVILAVIGGLSYGIYCKIFE